MRPPNGERTQIRQSPKFVAGAFDEDGPIVRRRSGGGDLVVQVAEQILRRLPVQIVMLDETFDRRCWRKAGAGCE